MLKMSPDEDEFAGHGPGSRFIAHDGTQQLARETEGQCRRREVAPMLPLYLGAYSRRIADGKVVAVASCPSDEAGSQSMARVSLLIQTRFISLSLDAIGAELVSQRVIATVSLSVQSAEQRVMVDFHGLTFLLSARTGHNSSDSKSG